MNIFQIAINNLKRRKIKMLFLIIGLTVGVSTVIALFGIIESMRLELGNKLDAFGPNIVIVPLSEELELNYGNTTVQGVTFEVKLLTQRDLPLIKSIPDGDSVNIISPKLVGAVTVGNKKALLVGVEPKNEFIMKPWFSLRELSGIPEGGEITDLALLELPADGIILGSNIAKAYEAKTGDVLVINQRNFTVTGILNEMGIAEDGLIFANLSVVQDLLGKPGEFSMIEVSGFCNFCPIEDMTEQIATVLQNARVSALRQTAMLRDEAINRFSTFGFMLSGVILLIAAMVVMTTMLSSVNERTLEIGIFRAIGFRRKHVMEIIFIEVLFVSVIAGIAGYIVGSVAGQVAGSFLTQIQTGPSIMQLQNANSSIVDAIKAGFTLSAWNTALIAPAIGLSVIISVLASIYPAIKAANMDPVEALRFI